MKDLLQLLAIGILVLSIYQLKDRVNKLEYKLENVNKVKIIKPTNKI